MQLVCKLAEEHKVPSEDWESLVWHNGKLFSGSTSNGNVKVWTEDLKPITEFTAHDFPIYDITAGNGKTLFTSSTDNTIKHWEETDDGRSFRLLTTLEGHLAPPRKLVFHNGKLYSGDEKGDVKVWQDGSCMGTIETLEEIWYMDVASEKELVTARNVDVTVFSISERDGKVRGSVQNSIPGRSPVHVTRGGQLCCVDRTENVINVHNQAKSGNPLLGKLKGHEAIINAITSFGETLITGGWDKSVIAWKLHQLDKPGEKVLLDGYINVIAVGPDGTIYAAGENKFITCLRI